MSLLLWSLENKEHFLLDWRKIARGVPIFLKTRFDKFIPSPFATLRVNSVERAHRPEWFDLAQGQWSEA